MDKKTTYQVLRDEIIFTMQRYDNYHIAAYTVCVALWSLAITVGKAWLTIIPLIIMLPISLRMCECRYVIEKLGTYLSVFLESNQLHDWEYMKNTLEKEKKKNRTKFVNRHSSIYDASKFSVIFLCIISSGLFWCIPNGIFADNKICVGVIVIVFQLFATITQAVIWIKNMDTSKYREELKADWRTIKRIVNNKKRLKRH